MALTHERAERSTIGIRKGDQVRVIAGRDSGKSGRVLSVNAKKNTVVVEHIAIMKRHTRPNPGKNIKGGIVEKEAGINVSNVMVVCSNCGTIRDVHPTGDPLAALPEQERFGFTMSEVEVTYRGLCPSCA